MSLILDALRKLERDRDAREPGVLVVGSVPWGGRSRSRRPLVMALGAAGLVALLAAAWGLSRPSSRPAGASPEPVAPAAAPGSPPPVTLPSPAAASPRDVAPPPRPGPRSASVPVEAVAAPPAAAAEPTPDSVGAPAIAPADDLRLQAISERGGRPVALIGDRLVFEGDRFDGVTVLRIGDAEVEVEVRGARRVLRFP